MVALERGPEHPHVLRNEARQRDGQVEAQRDVAAAIVLEAVELLVALVAALAEQDLGVLERRRIDRAEAERAIDASSGLDQALTRDHRAGQVIAEALEGPRLDQILACHGWRTD